MSSESTTLKTIAAVFPHSNHRSSLDIIRGIHRALRLFESSHRLIVLDTDDDDGELSAEREAEALKTVVREGIAGAILWQVGGETSEAALASILDAGVPVVCIDRYPVTTSCDYVGVDNRSGARYAVEYLMRLGHQRIVHFTLPDNDNEVHTSAVVERRLGFEEAMALRGITTGSKQIYSDQAELLGLLRSADENRPTAVFAVNDHSAANFVQEAAKLGLSVPEDFSIVGFDGLSSLWHPAAWLTTMNISFNDIGDRATELLLRRISYPMEPAAPRQHILLPTTLVPRTSCREITPSVPALRSKSPNA